MNLRLAEKKEFYKRKSPPVLYLVEKDSGVEKGKNITKSRGVFPLLLAAVLFLCLGILLNIGLRMQSINYQKKIYEINEMISLEEERTDRLSLKVSELKSPSRIINIAGNELGMEISEGLNTVELSNSILENNEKIYDYVSKDNTPILDNIEKYDNFLGTIYYIKDIVKVISESVLTFFIP